MSHDDERETRRSRFELGLSDHRSGNMFLLLPSRDKFQVVSTAARDVLQSSEAPARLAQMKDQLCNAINANLNLPPKSELIMFVGDWASSAESSSRTAAGNGRGGFASLGGKEYEFKGKAAQSLERMESSETVLKRMLPLIKGTQKDMQFELSRGMYDRAINLDASKANQNAWYPADPSILPFYVSDGQRPRRVPRKPRSILKRPRDGAA